jgi:hypothetical protein
VNGDLIPLAGEPVPGIRDRGKSLEEQFHPAAELGVSAAGAVEITGSLRDRFLAARGNKDHFDLRRLDDGNSLIRYSRGRSELEPKAGDGEMHPSPFRTTGVKRPTNDSAPSQALI